VQSTNAVNPTPVERVLTHHDLSAKQAAMRERNPQERTTDALYRCLNCGTRRTYGRIDSTPGYQPLLKCSKCPATARHEFLQLIDATEQ
jgi:hypothetical protein